MPGSKRRALKNMLSPSSTSPSNPTSSSSSPSSSVPVLDSANGNGIADDPANYVPIDSKEEAILEEMEKRVGDIGISGSEHAGVSPVPIPYTSASTGSGAVPPPPAPHAAAQPGIASSSASQKSLGESIGGIFGHHKKSSTSLSSQVETTQGGGGLSKSPTSTSNSGGGFFSSLGHKKSTSSSHSRKSSSSNTIVPPAIPTSPTQIKSGLPPISPTTSRSTPNGIIGGSGSMSSVTAEMLSGGNAGGLGASGKKKSSKQRFQEREAKKKAALLATAESNAPSAEQSAKMDQEIKEEREVIRTTCRELGVEVHEVPPDGHCIYNAISDQLHILQLLDPSVKYIPNDPSPARKAAATYLRAHVDDFLPFVSSIYGEDMKGSTDDGMMTPEGYETYCARVEKSGDWGGEIEIQALSKHFQIPIHVIQRGPPVIISHSPGDDGSGAMTAKESKGIRAVRISYHRRMYGLGEHYNSLRPV